MRRASWLLRATMTHALLCGCRESPAPPPARPKVALTELESQEPSPIYDDGLSLANLELLQGDDGPVLYLFAKEASNDTEEPLWRLTWGRQKTHGDWHSFPSDPVAQVAVLRAQYALYAGERTGALPAVIVYDSSQDLEALGAIASVLRRAGGLKNPPLFAPYLAKKR